jgi:hypothetical protein
MNFLLQLTIRILQFSNHRHALLILIPFFSQLSF